MVRTPMYRIALLALVLCSSAEAQISLWQIGGAGLAWDGSDTTRIIMDINAERIRPVYFADGDNMFLAVAGWSELIIPRELGYIDGHQPRLWYTNGTNVNQTSYYDSPLYVDGLRSTYNTARDGWWTHRHRCARAGCALWICYADRGDPLRRRAAQPRPGAGL